MTIHKYPNGYKIKHQKNKSISIIDHHTNEKGLLIKFSQSGIPENKKTALIDKRLGCTFTTIGISDLGAYALMIMLQEYFTPQTTEEVADQRKTPSKQ